VEGAGTEFLDCLPVLRGSVSLVVRKLVIWKLPVERFQVFVAVGFRQDGSRCDG
jgi:hypothetical protein